MHKQDRLAFRIVFCLMLGSPLVLGAQDGTGDLTARSGKPKVAIQVSDTIFDCETGIRFKWIVKNFSSENIYLYTTFVGGPAPNLLVYDENTNTIVIPTSATSEVSFPPYSYPDPVFKLLVPQQVTEGSFNEPISSQVSCKNYRPDKLVFEIAWGRDPSQLTTEISRIKKEGRVHPANPIVHWANVTRSKPVAITYIPKSRTGN